MTTVTRPLALSQHIDDVIDRAIEEERVVGTRVLVSVDGEVVHRRSAGLADREAGTPMPSDPLFLLASISKPVVTAAAMSLVETGELALDAPITRYLPDFRPSLPDGTTPEITIEQLLTHTAGLSYGMDPEGFEQFARVGASTGLDLPGLTAQEAEARLAKVPLIFAPGERWSYSPGIDVVGWAIEAITGRRLGEVVAERITGPLGLTDLGFSVTDPSRLVVPYIEGPSGPERMRDGDVVESFGFSMRFAPSRIDDPGSYHSGGAGMAGSAESVLAVLEAIRTGGGPILAPSTVEEMTRARAGEGQTERGPGVAFGLGWSVVTDPAAIPPSSVGTLQWGGVYGHTWFVDPARRLTVVALTNAVPEGLFGAFPEDIRKAVYRAL
ncbi:serine hydrolase domain-containing protein [Luteipulveratus mongoliensis]|uniref:Beta-lactamase n=1 Tax=Luteipulveratus mongoliensis TaxID=571913 RepID=A0A0K1JF78_9MICO|nr:serine hydrolase domain-containing protein [Luteipulveratus mongoliensis]AKU15369.1 beta-lactamase [Luteipulveratus mongoliensis]